ncbi:sugar kinase [Halobacillus sp. Marseille-Q1614]|uniref:sugar kinase n=1 Tax=Halobacillus sp. Marseille-Q1614 TaxID=2709134 RepID=UPI0015700ABE|nr:sugar kinase [Halobacillus sp. Marseille-Q1614]
MKDIITIGDAMIAFEPNSTGPMRFANQFQKKVGGAELNVMVGCSRLGLNTGWISRLGQDEFGKTIRNYARGEGVDVSEVEFVEGHPTSVYFKEMMEDGSVRTFYYREKSPTLPMGPEDLNEDYIKQAKILHVTGIFPAIDESNVAIIEQAIALAKKHDVKVSFDPNIRLKLWSKEQARETLAKILPDIDILLAGAEEMDILIGESDPDKIIEETKNLGIPYTAIKLGSEGSVGYYEGEKLKAPPVPPKKVVDTVGAGDGFNAGFLYGFLQKWPLEKILHFANTIGSMVVGVKGDNEGLPYYEEVQVLLGEKELIER